MLQDDNGVAKVQQVEDLTFDDAAFYEAVERRRMEAGLSWRQVGRELGLSPSTFSRLARGRRPDIETFMKLLVWLDVPAQRFLRGAAGAEESGVPDTVGLIATALRADPAIGRDEAGALEQLFRIAYAQLRTETSGSARATAVNTSMIDTKSDGSKGAS